MGENWMVRILGIQQGHSSGEPGLPFLKGVLGLQTDSGSWFKDLHSLLLQSNAAFLLFVPGCFSYTLWTKT